MTVCLSLYIFVLCFHFFEFQMELSTSNAEEEEPCELYIPVAKKARLVTSFNECIICQNNRKEKLWTAKESSIKTLLAALERRHTRLTGGLWLRKNIFKTKIIPSTGIPLATRLTQVNKIYNMLKYSKVISETWCLIEVSNVLTLLLISTNLTNMIFSCLSC